MIKLIVLATLFVTSMVAPAFAEAPTNTTDEHGREYVDIFAGRENVTPPEEFDESTLKGEGNDPGHYDGPEETSVTPPEGCPSDTEYLRHDDDDQNLINRSRRWEHDLDAGK